MRQDAALMRPARVMFITALLVIGVMSPAEAAARTCLGHRATVVGTNRADDLHGPAGDDVIVAKGGNDTVDGRGGNDRICGGGGEDTLLGGTGIDRLSGGTGSDTMDGGDGTDVASF